MQFFEFALMQISFILYDSYQAFCRSTSGKTVSPLTADLGVTVVMLPLEIILVLHRLSKRSPELSGSQNFVYESFVASYAEFFSEQLCRLFRDAFYQALTPVTMELLCQF